MRSLPMEPLILPSERVRRSDVLAWCCCRVAHGISGGVLINSSSILVIAGLVNHRRLVRGVQDVVDGITAALLAFRLSLSGVEMFSPVKSVFGYAVGVVLLSTSLWWVPSTKGVSATV